jgi:LmbE family N-acetylglucosaminyl deacetylase
MTILVVVAHPDDEVLGCGASIAKWADAGLEPHIMIMAEGVTSRDHEPNREGRSSELRDLALAAEQSGKVLGAASVTLKKFPDNRMDSVDQLDVVKVVEDQVALLKPDMVVTHHVGDINIDHQIVHQAVVTACRPQPGHPVRRLLSFEVPSSTEWQSPNFATSFQPNWFEEVVSTWDRKLAALEVYSMELRLWPHPRSISAIEYLARWRGCTIGFEVAEAFQLIRGVN